MTTRDFYSIDDFDTKVQFEEFSRDQMEFEWGFSTDVDDQTPPEEEFDDDDEPVGSYNLSDDGDALASAGFGTDEDYGYYVDDIDY